MATYGYSTPYTGQRQPTLPPGYMEAATAPGRNIAAGIQQFAAGLGQTIQRYQANKAETEAATQTYETLVGMAQQALQTDPQYQALERYYKTGELPQGVTESDLNRFSFKVNADRSMLNKMAGIGEKFGDMSLAKKKAAIGDMAMVLGQYQNRATEDLKRRQLELSVNALAQSQKERADIQDLIKTFVGMPTTREETVFVQPDLQAAPAPTAPQAPAAPVPVSAGGTGEWPAGLPPVSAGPVRRQYTPTQPPQGMMNTGIPVGGAMQFAQRSPSQIARMAASTVPVTPVEPTAQPAPQPVAETAPVEPVTMKRTVPIPYEETRANLLKIAAERGMSLEAVQAIEPLLAMAGQRKALQVDQMQLASGAQVIRADGKVEILPPAKPVEGKPLTDAQGKAIQFAAAMRANNDTVNQIIEGGYSPGGVTVSQWIPERLKTDDRKAYEAARDRWIENFLRGRSGAAITKEEYPAAERQYFPVAGDSRAVIKAKAKAREEQYRGELAKGGDNASSYLQQIIGAAKPDQQAAQPVQTRRSTSGTTYQIQKY